MADSLLNGGRRHFLGLGLKAGVAAALTGTGLAACGDSSSRGGRAGRDSVSFQLSWLKNVEFGGTYIAIERGYYTKQKIDVDLLAGGPNVSVAPVVASGKALIGQTGLDEVVAAFAKGGPFKVVGLSYQHNPYALASMPDDAIRSPEDMYGKRIGVPATNLTGWNAFLKLNGLDASKINRVPVQFDPTVLTNGQVQGLMCFLTNEPTQPALRKAKVHVFAFEDFNYHLASNAYIVRNDTLTDTSAKKKVVRFLKGELKGWQDAIAAPSSAADLAVKKYGTGLKLDPTQQLLEAEAEAKLMVTDWTKAHGLATFSDELVTESFHTLAASGINADPSKLMDRSVLEEVYANGPTL